MSEDAIVGLIDSTEPYLVQFVFETLSVVDNCFRLSFILNSPHIWQLKQTAYSLIKPNTHLWEFILSLGKVKGGNWAEEQLKSVTRRV